MNAYSANMDYVTISGQKENVFLDDMIIVEPGKTIYHQLKDVKGLTWAYGSSHTLGYDFDCQQKACNEAGETFELKLVYSDPDSDITTVPPSFSGNTTLVNFTSATDINACILANKDFLDSLSAISADKKTDKITDLGICIYGVWGSMQQNDVRISDIYRKVLAVSRTRIVLMNYPVVPMTSTCKGIFNRLGVTFANKGNLILWRKGRFTGNIPWTDAADMAICDNNPSNFIEFFTLVNNL